jgi:uncharacterized metal-binding protein YceD (DUF177 family)
MTTKSSERAALKSRGGSPADLPFSRVALVEQVPEAGIDVAIDATAEERAGLAVCDGLVGIGGLEAFFHVVPRPGKRFNVSGRVSASITQICVVTLEPFESTIAEDVDVDFVLSADLPKPEAAKAREPALRDEQEEDPPDEIFDGKIDLGALAAEFLALALDPYPRKPGARFEEVLTEKPEEPESPFAVLRRLDKTF